MPAALIAPYETWPEPAKASVKRAFQAVKKLTESLEAEGGGPFDEPEWMHMLDGGDDPEGIIARYARSKPPEAILVAWDSNRLVSYSRPAVMFSIALPNVRYGNERTKAAKRLQRQLNREKEAV